MIVGEAAAVSALARGEVVAVPTDTVYGLAVDPRRDGATRRLFALKGRPEMVPLPVLVADRMVAERLGVLDGPALLLAERFWPGALTIVVPRRPAAAGFELGGDPATIGLRCPDHAVVSRLLRASGPLAVSSANRHGGPPCRSAAEVLAAFAGAVRVLDGGEADGEPSTVVALGPEGVSCLRGGAIPFADIEGVLGGDDAGAGAT